MFTSSKFYISNIRILEYYTLLYSIMLYNIIIFKKIFNLYDVVPTFKASLKTNNRIYKKIFVILLFLHTLSLVNYIFVTL